MSDIVDQLGRPLKTIRISVTDECNFRCTYCMPREKYASNFNFAPKNELLSFDEIERWVKIAQKMGVNKVKLTGGEPLLRSNISVLIKKLKNIHGITEVSLITNGHLLVGQLPSLKKSGLDQLTVSLDSLLAKRSTQITGGFGRQSIILDGINKALDLGFSPIKINVVVIKNMNDDEIVPMIDYFADKNIILRFIEFMDVGNSIEWDLSQTVSYGEMLQKIKSKYAIKKVVQDETAHSLVGKRYQVLGKSSLVEFVTAVSDPFCSSCDRGRLSATGDFYNCLFSVKGLPFRELLRDKSVDDEQILDIMINSWKLRKDRYSEERQDFINAGKIKNNKIEMHMIGG